uniref:Uncharacterized protein n=1 Tax=Oryza meridionalis TaxID=40149 RepID=A0A0E0EWF1_9ORYZ
MVKTVVGEEAQLKALEETLSASASPAQMGLIVGKLSASSDRALAYSLIPTPPTDSGAPACSLLRAAPNPKAAKAASSDASSSLDFDVDWVAEHARQVSRMLLGGMTVIGIYIWASEASFKATSPAVLSQVLRAVSQFLDGMDNTLEGPHNVEFLVPFKNNLPAEEGVAGLLLFAGSVSALAYLGPKESIAEVISDLKLDIITSLRSRLDIILDEADDDSTTNNLENSLSQKATQVVFHELRVPYSFPFPRRILIPWLAGSYICDYLQQSETTEDAMERCKEVMSLEADMGNYSIVEPESASAATLGSFWDVVPGALSKAPSEPGLKEMNSGQNGSRKTHGSSFSILMAFVVLLIAVLVGCIFTLSATLMT